MPDMPTYGVTPLVVLACLACRYLTQALVVYERLGILMEPDKVRKELAELPG